MLPLFASIAARIMETMSPMTIIGMARKSKKANGGMIIAMIMVGMVIANIAINMVI